MTSQNKSAIVLITLVLFTASVFSVTVPLTETTYRDFLGGSAVNIDIVTPDPDGLDDGALVLSANDSIYVLQVFPDGHCSDCISEAVYTYQHDGTPSLNFKFYLIPISHFNSISSVYDTIRVWDSRTGDPVELPLTFFDILFFGIANGYGGRSNDLSSSAKEVVVQYARLGKGIVLTHDTIAKRHGWDWAHPLCTDTRDFVHNNFNTLTDVTGLTASWVSCYAPDSLYDNVYRNPAEPAGAPVFNVPFHLPTEFSVTACHNFGETFATGDIWYYGEDGTIYFQTYHNVDYNSYASFFSTGHQEETDGDSFRPSEWETKAMINAMFYSYFGGGGIGAYTSRIYHLPCEASLNSTGWSITADPYDIITFQVRLSSDSISWTDWLDTPTGTSLSLPNFRYIQYRLLLTRGGVELPIVHSITLYIYQASPQAELLYPIEYSSCECATIAWRISTTEPLSDTSFAIEIGSHRFESDYFTYNADDSTLLFEGDTCFHDGDTVSGELVGLGTTSGCRIMEGIPFEYVVDLSPPTLDGFVPAPDTILANPAFPIAVHIEDVSGIPFSSLVVSVNTDTLHSGVVWDGVTGQLTVNPDIAHIFYADTVVICIGASDRAEGCGANDTFFCYSFYVDTIPPDVVPLSEGYTSCESLSVQWQITDNAVGIDTTSLIVMQGGYTYYYPDGMSFVDSLLTFIPGYVISDGETVSVRLFSAADELGNTGHFGSQILIGDQSPPVATPIYPLNGVIIGNPSPTLIFLLIDSLSGVNTTDIRINIGGGHIYSSDMTISGDTVRVDLSALGYSFDDGDTVRWCIRATDLASGCGVNVVETCFVFIVNTSGPVASFLAPPLRGTTSCKDGPIYLSVIDPNGVVPSSIGFSVDDMDYTVSDPNVSYRGDTLTFIPTVSWSDAETVAVVVYAAQDSVGNPISDTLDGYFIVDLSPPVVAPLYPIVGGTVDTIEPNISIQISDELSPVALSSLSLDIDGALLSYIGGSPGLSISDDTVKVNFHDAGITASSETVWVSVSVSDSVDFCEPNETTYTYFFLVDKRGPEGEFLYPDSGAYWSCAYSDVRLRVFDPNGVVDTSLAIRVNDSMDIHYPDPRLVLSGDTLIYAPSARWGNGDTITVALIAARDTIGNELTDTVRLMFIIDLSPPVVIFTSPADSDTTIDPYQSLAFAVNDSLCGVLWDSASVSFDGGQFGYTTLTQIADTLLFDPSSVGRHLWERQWNSFVLHLSDCAEGCGHNISADTMNLFLLDDDTLPPVFLNYSPTLWLEDSAFTISIKIIDSSGVFTPASYDPYRALLIYDNDGEIVSSADTVQLVSLSTSGDTTTLASAVPIPPQTNGVPFVFGVHLYDDDFDFGVDADRTVLDTSLFVVEIAPRPLVSLISPQESSVVSCQPLEMIFAVSGDYPINEETISLYINGDTVAYPDSRLTFGNDTFRITMSDSFADGAFPIKLISARDEMNYPAIAAEWTIFIDRTPPSIEFQYPANGAMLPSHSPYLNVAVWDDVAGVNYDSLTIYIISSSGDTIAVLSVDSSGCIAPASVLHIDFDMCNIPYEDGDSFTVVVDAYDNPDLCPPNSASANIWFWLEPELPCAISTNPFTPNGDGYNDNVFFTFPNLFSKGGTIELFDLRGVKVATVEVPPGGLKQAFWDGLTKKARKSASGAYIYVIYAGGEKVCEGTLTLIR